MKTVSNILSKMEATLNGSLDGLELDNTDDVIEKSAVIEMVNNLKLLVNDAQQQVKNFNIPAVINQRELLIAYESYCRKLTNTKEQEGDRMLIEEFLSNL